MEQNAASVSYEPHSGFQYLEWGSQSNGSHRAMAATEEGLNRKEHRAGEISMFAFTSCPWMQSGECSGGHRVNAGPRGSYGKWFREDTK